jgi:hypothetical protein
MSTGTRSPKADPKVADKMVDAVLREARSAVIESDAEAQSLTRFGRPGTVAGRVAANIFQFKSFPLTLVMDQARRIAEINERKGRAAAATYGVSFVAGMTILGMVSMQLKEIAKGKDMRPVTPKLVRRVRAGRRARRVRRSRRQLQERPRQRLRRMAGGTDRAFAATSPRRSRAGFRDPETGERGRKFGFQASRLARRYTPGTTIWYARAALDRMLWDELQERIDPDFADHQQRLIESANRQGQDYYYAPGDGLLPHRAPTMGESPP